MRPRRACHTMCLGAKSSRRFARSPSRSVGENSAFLGACGERRSSCRPIRALWVACLAIAFGIALAETPASAAELQGYVLELIGNQFLLDLGADGGAKKGEVVELWRAVKVRHPVTGQQVTERFQLGRLRLVHVRPAMSVARIEGTLSDPPQVGDIVILRTAGPALTPSPAPGSTHPILPQPSQPVARPSRPAPPAETPSASFAAPDAAPPAERAVAQQAVSQGTIAAAEVSALFDSLKGTDLYTRARAYEEYARKHQGTPLSRVLWEEALQLRQLLLLASRGKPHEQGLQVRSFSAPPSVVEGQVPSLAVQILGPARGAILFTRNKSEAGYVSRPMRAAGSGYFRGDIPIHQLRAPGIEYFIEAVGPDGRGQAVVGADAHPLSIQVQRRPVPRAENLEASLSVLSDYADWNRLRGDDWVWQTEGSVGVRITDVGLRAVRSGFGVYRGRGGSVDELDNLGISRRVGLTYGYLESEFGLSSFTGLIARGVIGLRETGVTGGAQAFVRLGNDKSTNLLLGGEVLGGVGLRGITELNTSLAQLIPNVSVLERVPVVLRTEVTNQPAGEEPKSIDTATPGSNQTSQARAEVGARGILQIGYRVVPSFMIAVRGSYQGRSVRHSGPGAGAAVSYQW
jgi:hypothetical protein